MSFDAELQRAIWDRLKADDAVGALAGDRIHDNVPLNAPLPYVGIGERQVLPTGSDCLDGADVFMDIHCYAGSNGRVGPAGRLAGAVTAALDGAHLDLGDYGWAELSARYRAFLDGDGATGHGVVTVEAVIVREED